MADFALLESLKLISSKNLCDRKIMKFPHCDPVTSTLCGTQFGNYRNLISHIFDKNFVKPTFLLKKLLKNWLYGQYFQWGRILRFSTLCGIATLFYVTKNLVEIKVGECKVSKPAFFTHLEVLNFSFYEFWHFLRAKLYQIDFT